LPKYLDGIWRAFKAGLNLGITLLTLSFDVGKYVLQNLLPDMAKGLYRLAKYCFQNIPEVMKALYDATKFLITHTPDIIEGIYNICKSVIKFSYNFTKSIAIGIYNNLGEILRWSFNNAPKILANTIGIIVGLIYAPFVIGAELLREGMRKIMGGEPSSTSNPQQTPNKVGTTAEPVIQASYNGLTMQYDSHKAQQIAQANKPQEEVIHTDDIESGLTGATLRN